MLQEVPAGWGTLMESKAHTYVLNIALSLVPDLALCWVASNVTESGWVGFWVSLIGLQAIYFFFWLKQALWSWLLFWTIGKRQMARHVENSLIDGHFPEPNEYISDLDDYFGTVANDETVDPNTRVKAAYEHGALNGLKLARRYSAALQLNLAGAIALKRYARLAQRFRPRDA